VADVVDAATRSRMMSGIRGKDTKPEMEVRRALHAAGFRFRLHRRDLPGAPDVVLPGLRAAIFVHGCFWHMHKGCRYSKIPSTRAEFWKAKLEGNAKRDRLAKRELLAAGWRVLVVWECTVRDRETRASLSGILAAWMHGDEIVGEVRSGTRL
jgi:DNA mismatch endonuclease (patch repair protein)